MLNDICVVVVLCLLLFHGGVGDGVQTSSRSCYSWKCHCYFDLAHQNFVGDSGDSGESDYHVWYLSLLSRLITSGCWIVGVVHDPYYLGDKFGAGASQTSRG